MMPGMVGTPMVDLVSAVSEGQITPEAGVELTSLPEGQFDVLVDQFIQNNEGADVPEGRLEALRETMEDMDESEVLGFLAMLESQSNWTPEMEAEASDLLPVAPVQEQPATAIQQALSKAMEDVIPAGSGDHRGGALNLMRLSETDQTKRAARDFSESPIRSMENREPLRAEVQAQSQSQVGEIKEAPLTRETLLSTVQTVTSDSLVTGQTNDAQQARTVTSNTTQNVYQFETATQFRPQTMGDQDAWSDAMGQRLVAMLGEGRQEASLRLDPPELGNLGVRLVVEDRGVSIQFHSPVPQVREMLEGQSDRLRQALEQQGLTLVDVNVGEGSADQQSGQGSEQSLVAGQNLESEQENLEWVERSMVGRSESGSIGLVNRFA